MESDTLIGVRVLLVEPDAMVRSLAQRVLERAGVVVLASSNTAQACRLAERSEAIHLLILELEREGDPHLTFITGLRRHHADLRILFTAGSVPSHVHVHHLPGALLQKPYQVSELLGAVRGALTEAAT